MRLLYRNVIFDVDSTLVTIEGIDELSRGNEEVIRLTAAAMNGEIALDEVYGRRLEIIRPSVDDLDQLGNLYVHSLVEGAKEVVDTLRAAGAQIHLVTAGIRHAILPLARALEIPERAIHAVSIWFDTAGAYAGFDQRSFLTRNGGKELVIRDLRARSKGTAALVGDGVSDLEARTAVDRFIGFGGVQVRPRVRDEAEIFVEDRDLRAVLPYLIER